MNDMPKGWGNARVSDIADYVSRGRSPKYIPKSNLPIINQRCIRWEGIDEKYLKFIDPATWEQWADERYLRPNDILWNSTGTGTLGRAALFRKLEGYERAVVDSHVTIVRPNKYIDAKYLFYYIKSPNIQDRIEDMQSGSTNQVELNRSTVLETAVPVAPLLEQKRIVDKIEGLTNRIAYARAELSRIPTLLSKYKARILELAVTGGLTKDWRTDRNSLLGPNVSLGTVATRFNYGTSTKSSKEGDIPVLRMGNIQKGKLAWSDLVFTSSQTDIQKYKLTSGDVLFNRTNSPELVGKTAVFKGEREAIFAGYIIRIRCGDDLLPDYLSYCLNSPQGRQYSWQIKSDGVSQSNINAKKLAAFEFLLPSVSEQNEIIRRVEIAFDWVDRVTDNHNTAIRLLPELDASILSKAFRGELVPQDINDEPANIPVKKIGANEKRTPGGVRATREMSSSGSVKRRQQGKVERGKSMNKSRLDDDVNGKPYLATKIKARGPVSSQELFQIAELSVADFYKQLVWEIEHGHIDENAVKLRAK